jgi:hypothetical protein
MLDAPWPCEAACDFPALWPKVMQPFEVKGTPLGPASFGGWGDGGSGLVRAVWCLVRHLRPNTVIETGVARGFTSRFILEALERNGRGHLWSIDLPPMRAPKLHSYIGAAVRPELHHRWSYVRGTSRQHLPKLLAQLKQVDLFVHDSRHTERNVLFELTQAWSALRVRGAVVADDIHENCGFDAFSRRVSPPFVLNCYAGPATGQLQRSLRGFAKVLGHARRRQRPHRQAHESQIPSRPMDARPPVSLVGARPVRPAACWICSSS